MAKLNAVVAENLKRIRELSDLTQKRLGELSGVSPNTINTYERGKANISGGILSALAAALKVEESDLVNPAAPPKPIEHTPSECLANAFKALESLPDAEADVFAREVLKALRRR